MLLTLKSGWWRGKWFRKRCLWFCLPPLVQKIASDLACNYVVDSVVGVIQFLANRDKVTLQGTCIPTVIQGFEGPPGWYRGNKAVGRHGQSLDMLNESRDQAIIKSSCMSEWATADGLQGMSLVEKMPAGQTLANLEGIVLVE